MYRDFIYLDINKAQSIVSQLQEGLLTSLIQGKSHEFGGSSDFGKDLLSRLLPIGASVEAKAQFSSSENKILEGVAKITLRS